jgi:hypothetical protein
VTGSISGHPAGKKKSRKNFLKAKALLSLATRRAFR